MNSAIDATLVDSRQSGHGFNFQKSSRTLLRLEAKQHNHDHDLPEVDRHHHLASAKYKHATINLIFLN